LEKPLQLEKMGQNQSCLRFPSSSTIIKRQILTACANDDFDQVQQLLFQHKRLNVNHIRYGRDLLSLLHSLCHKGRLDLVTYLVETRQAKVNLKDSLGWTPLLYAAENGHVEICEYLIAHGGDIHSRNNYGDNALFKAALNGHLKCCQFLINQGIDVNCKNKYDSTALFRAASGGHLQICEYLIEAAGMDVQAINKNGASAVDAAIWEGYVDVVKYLTWRSVPLPKMNQLKFGFALDATIKNSVVCYVMKDRVREMLLILTAATTKPGNWGNNSLIRFLPLELIRMLLPMLETPTN
jgi:hypothetical protein